MTGALATALLLAMDIEAGARIYREVLPLSCASCHRRSGYGATEGTVYVPPVTGEVLFGTTSLASSGNYERLFQQASSPLGYAARRVSHPRPPYTDATLGELLREGRTPAGRTIDPIMPRYELTDGEIALLGAYLRSLATKPVPGVDGRTIRFATVVSEGVSPERRQALLDVMHAYIRWKNDATSAIRLRSSSPLWYQQELARDDRNWALDVWELRGPAATWPAQLDTLHRDRPVFAILGGLAGDGWQPVHDFCEREEMPCVFPETDRPVVAGEGSYTLYLSRGLEGEAQTLARHLAETPFASGPIVQVFRGNGRGAVLADALRRASPLVQDRDIGSGPLDTALLLRGNPRAIVLWLDEVDLAAIPTIPGSVEAVYLSHGLLGRVPQVRTDLRSRVRMTYPYALPAAESPHRYRVRAWLRARGVASLDERLQLDTWFALAVTENALARLAGRISRDAFVERVEEETESTANPGVFPRLSLGPGQRFASTGSYVVALSEDGSGVTPVSEWIVP